MHGFRTTFRRLALGAARAVDPVLRQLSNLVWFLAFCLVATVVLLAAVTVHAFESARAHWRRARGAGARATLRRAGRVASRWAAILTLLAFGFWLLFAPVLSH